MINVADQYMSDKILYNFHLLQVIGVTNQFKKTHSIVLVIHDACYELYNILVNLDTLYDVSYKFIFVRSQIHIDAYYKLYTNTHITYGECVLLNGCYSVFYLLCVVIVLNYVFALFWFFR